MSLEFINKPTSSPIKYTLKSKTSESELNNLARIITNEVEGDDFNRILLQLKKATATKLVRSWKTRPEMELILRDTITRDFYSINVIEKDLYMIPIEETKEWRYYLWIDAEDGGEMKLSEGIIYIQNGDMKFIERDDSWKISYNDRCIKPYIEDENGNKWVLFIDASKELRIKPEVEEK